MTYPGQDPQEPKVLPGYFSPAAAPPQAEQEQSAPAAPMSYPPVAQPEPQYQPAYLNGNVQQYAQQQFGQQAQPSAPSQPLYPASFLQAVGRFYGKYAKFSGRASRSEFWWVQLALAVLFFLGAMFIEVTGSDGIAGLYAMFVLGSIVPYIALTVRRLHDANFSGGLGALWLVPYVGFVVVGILALMPSSPQGVRFEKASVMPGPYGQTRF